HYKIGSLMMLFVGLFLSCSKTEDLGSFVPKDPNMSFNSEMIEINKEGGEFTVAVESNLPWRAKANADWITLSAENSLGDGDIVFSVGRNRTVDQRIGEIKVWITKDYEKTIRVIQAPADLSDLVTHYYVKVSGSADNSGLSWSEATSLEKALDEVRSEERRVGKSGGGGSGRVIDEERRTQKE